MGCFSLVLQNTDKHTVMNRNRYSLVFYKTVFGAVLVLVNSPNPAPGLCPPLYPVLYMYPNKYRVCLNPSSVGGYFGQYETMQKTWKND